MPRVTGADQLRAVARDLRLAGGPGRGLRSRMRRNIVAAAQPIVRDVKKNALAIPADGPSGMGSLRQELADATNIRVQSLGRNASVRVQTAGGKMPNGKQSLPTLMEGLRRWRHPVFGDTDVWVSQAAHPYFYRAVNAHLGEVNAAVLAALDETATILARGRG